MTSLHQISTNLNFAHRVLVSWSSTRFLKCYHHLSAVSPLTHSENIHAFLLTPTRTVINSPCGFLRPDEKCFWNYDRRYLAAKPKRSLQEVADKKDGQVTVAKRVVQAGKDVSYLGIIVVGLGITALMFFTVGKELFSSKSPNVVYTRALKRCKNSDQVTSVFGLPLKGYGEMTRRRRRRHVSHFEYEKDGLRHMRVKFYIEGPDKKGTVNCEVRENESGDYEYRYLFVDVDGYPPQTIVLEDNR